MGEISEKEFISLFFTEHERNVIKKKKHEPQASVFYTSRVFPNDRSVLSQCNTRLRLLHLL